MITRFDLEQAIMLAWHTKDDIDLVIKNLLNNPMTPDEISNVLIGISALHELRSNALFDIFSTLIKEGSIT
jgi:hypothetical protein